MIRKYRLFGGWSVTCLDLFVFQKCFFVEDLGLALVGSCHLLIFNGNTLVFYLLSEFIEAHTNRLALVCIYIWELDNPVKTLGQILVTIVSITFYPLGTIKMKSFLKVLTLRCCSFTSSSLAQCFPPFFMSQYTQSMTLFRCEGSFLGQGQGGSGFHRPPRAPASSPPLTLSWLLLDWGNLYFSLTTL